MCGIAGIFGLQENSKLERHTLQEMLHMLHHRGPDDQGIYIDEKVGLAHARLSIIDLAGGGQPIYNENKTVWTVFNGEIFNYIELREKLVARGHYFYTQTDTEVIVHLYEEYGEDFVSQLNGQFAIAIWDIKLQKLLLVRDRVGILPLFYTVQDGQLLFASEVKAILAALANPPSLNPAALDQLMTFWAPVSPNTMFDNIFEVSPGQMLTVRNGNILTHSYWDWEFPQHNQFRSGSEEQLCEELLQLLIDATQIRLRADVPVGAYLSGGLDSSSLVSLIHHFSDAPLRTFSIGFDSKSFDESEHQNQMIKQINANNSHIICHDRDIADHFVDTIWHTESPVLRTAPVPMKLLSNLVRTQNYKVVLTGEGADEVFGGYDLFKESKLRQFWAKQPASVIRPKLLKRLYPYLDVSPGRAQTYLQNFYGVNLNEPNTTFFSHIPRWITTAKCKNFFHSDFKEQLHANVENTLADHLSANLKGWHYFNRAQYVEAKTLMSGYLLCSQGDRMLMANSIEGRFPFLDHRLIEFANQLHPNIKMKVLSEKYLLKKTMAQYIPKSIVQRHKQPYRAPDIDAFFSGNTPDFVYELLSRDCLSRYGYFDAKKVELLMAKIKAGHAIGFKDNMAFISILSTQIWHYNFIDNFSSKFLK
ncbi:MAG: asparagine synthase (glutamine-hydrolyzing) [Psychromonas sp.]|nr:asparagine synthase (glutamine-hydrolyzing) [Psychromonas sp.]